MGDTKKTEAAPHKQQEVVESWSFPAFADIGDASVIENDILYRDPFRHGMGKEYILENLYIWYGKFKTLAQKSTLIVHAQPHIQLFFCLGSGMAYRHYANQKVFAKFKEHQQNMFSLPNKPLYVVWQPSEDFEAFSINISTKFFCDFLAPENPFRIQLQDAIRNDFPAFLHQKHRPLTPRMIAVLFEILNNDYSGHQKGLFIKAKVLELMVLQMDQQILAPTTMDVLQEADIKKMQHARQILTENLENTLSLKDLARQVGTNEFNLKKKFKILFGDTVFGYQHKYRMEKARELLCGEENKIAEVAQRVGYKHATHFTAAFKKHFGYLPNKIRIGFFLLLQSFENMIEMALESLDPTLLAFL